MRINPIPIHLLLLIRSPNNFCDSNAVHTKLNDDSGYKIESSPPLNAIITRIIAIDDAMIALKISRCNQLFGFQLNSVEHFLSQIGVIDAVMPATMTSMIAQSSVMLPSNAYNTHAKYDCCNANPVNQC